MKTDKTTMPQSVAASLSAEPLETVFLDTQKMAVDGGGVHPFFWPLSYEERESFAHSVVGAYIENLDKYIHGTAYDSACYQLAIKYFNYDVITLFCADALAQRFSANNKTAVFPDSFKIFPSVFARTDIPPAKYTAKLRRLTGTHSGKKPSYLNRAIRILSTLKFGLSAPKIDNLLLKRVTPAVLERSIIATQRTPLISKQAGAADEDIVFCKSDRWFSPVSDGDLKDELGRAHSAFEESIISSVECLYKKFGIDLTAASKAHLKKTFSETAAAIRVHEKRLRASSVHVPKRIWTGTTGNTWDTLLRLETMRRGGHSIAHDHGAGQGYVDNIYTGLLELWGCDEYVTFNERHAKELERFAPGWPNPFKHRPRIYGQKHDTGNKGAPAIFSKFRKEGFSPKNIVFLPSLYDGEMGRMGPCVHDIVHADWQGQLIQNITSWGYDVTFKIHPDSKIFPPESFKSMGAKFVTTPFEDVLGDADLLLFDCVYSTTLLTAVETNIPIVLIDFFDHPWTERGRDLFTKRAEMIRAGFDANNRKQLDWNTLKQAFETAPRKSENTDYFDFYYD